MADIIDFPGSALGKCRSEIKERDDTIARLELALQEERRKLADAQAVVQMLKLQLNELFGTLGGLNGSLTQTMQNINVLKDKLPDFKA